MKTTSKKLITSVLTLVLTVIALGTTTFAWFSLSTVSNISNISGDVRAGDGLEVKLVGKRYHNDGTVLGEVSTKWRSHLSNEDISEFIDGAYDGTNVIVGKEGIFYNQTFDAVTTKDVAAFKKTGFTTKGYIYVDKDDAVKNVDYIEFTIHFRSKESGIVELTKLDIDGDLLNDDFDVDGDDYVQYPEAEPSALDVVTSAAYGARVSFDTNVFQFGKATDKAEESDEKVVGNTFMSGTKPIVAGQYSYITDSKGQKFYMDDDANEYVIADNTFKEAHGNEDLYTDVEKTNARVKVTLNEGQGADEGYYVGNLTVRIWIEGWDADTYDAMFNATLDISMTFNKKD